MAALWALHPDRKSGRTLPKRQRQSNAAKGLILQGFPPWPSAQTGLTRLRKVSHANRPPATKMIGKITLLTALQPK
jgi:hypothetical protein